MNHFDKKLLVLTLWPFLSAQGQMKNIWQIGKFDQSPLEFSASSKDEVIFQAGKSDWKKDWPAIQGLKRPRRIEFQLDAARRAYTLRIATIIEQPRVPILQIDVNGHVGNFYLHPELTYFPGNPSFAYHPNYSKSSLNALIPARYFKSGQNAISITCIDQPLSIPEEEQFSTVTYDALSLDEDESNRGGEDIAVRMEPTIFYKQSGAGLFEIVDAFVVSRGSLNTGVADLEFRGKHYRANVSPHEFGEQRISFELPDWSGAAAVQFHLLGNSGKDFQFTLASERKWNIFVVPHTHLDVGYTDYQGKVAEVQARVLSQAAELIREHPDFRFSMDGSWNLQQLLTTRPKSKQDEILDLIRNGKMAMPAQYCNLLTGYASLETLYRSLYKSKSLARQYNLPFEYANITDVPSYSGSYPSILAASGVKYWVAAANNDRAPIFYHDHWNEKSPFWWQGPDGGKVLFWYSWAYLQTQTLFGLPPGLNAVSESLPIFLQAYSKPGYKLDVALIYGTQVENTDLFPTTATFATEWNKEYAFPKLNYASFSDFFHYVEQHYGKDLPTYKGDGGPYWEDGVGSDAYYAAEDRQNQNRALSAEILSTVDHVVDPNLNPPDGLLDDIWRNIILFAEHTWASYNSITQPDHEQTIKQLRVKDDRAERATLDVEDLMNRSLSQLADQIHIPANTLVVFNSLSWARDAIVETDLLENPKIVDLSTKQEIPFQILSEKQHFLHVRFLAKDLPAVGYKGFAIVYGKAAAPKPDLTKEPTIENQFYRVRIEEDSGAVASIYDKQLQRELVDTRSPYKFGQCLYVAGGDGNTQLINPYPSLTPGELIVHTAAGGKLLGMERLPWGQSIRMSSSTVNLPKIETEILLFNDRKRIEFRFRLRKEYTTAKEAVYFSFPAAVSNPGFAYATQQGWVDTGHDMLRGGSTEWFSVHGWMAVHDTDVALGVVPLDASLASLGDLNRGKWPAEFRPKAGTLFSYAMNNYWDTNYRPGQGGDFTFRYTVTSSANLDGRALTHLGMEEMRPVELNHVVSQDKVGNPPRPLPAEGQSFLEVTGEDIALVTWKQAEDRNGTILRLIETSGRASETNIKFLHSDVRSAYLCSGVEDDQSRLNVANNSIRLSFKPFQVLTVRTVSK
jgi:alpha-mannosidase